MTARLTVICLPKYSQINDIVPQCHLLNKKRTFTVSWVCDSSVIESMHEVEICRKTWSNGIGDRIKEFRKEGR